MLAQDTSIWLFGQTVFTLVIAACCILLVLFKKKVSQKKSEPKRKKVHKKTKPSKQTESRLRPSTSPGKIVLAIVLIALGAFLIERGDDPVGVRPDSWSDANVVVSGRNYAKEGLWAHYGAAQHQVVTDQHPSDPFFLYTKYPVGSNLINGLWQIAGVNSVRIFRLLPAACSLLALVLWFGLFKRIAGQNVAIVATIVMALSYGFLAYADNLHFHAYAMLTSVAAMRCYLRAMDPDRKGRLRWFLMTALFMFITACFTWEYHLWMVLFIALYALLFKSPVRRPYLALLALPLFAALAMQVAQSRLALADANIEATGESQPRSSLLDDFYRRAFGFDTADSPAGHTLSSYPRLLLDRYYKFYGLPLLGVLALLAMLLMRDRRPPWKIRQWSDQDRLLVVLLVAGTGWWLIMLQHTAVHPHVMRHGLTGYALLLALVWTRCWKTTWSSTYPYITRGAAALLMLLLCYPQLEGLTYNLRMHYEKNFRYNRDRHTMGMRESEQMLKLKEAVPPGSVILTNHNRRPLMRFWTERPVYYGNVHRISRKTPINKPTVFVLRFNHLREIYNDNLPGLYFVYQARKSDLRIIFSKDRIFRFLLQGNNEGGDEAFKEAIPILREAVDKGRSDKTFCPIVAMINRMLIFKMDRAVPVLRRSFENFGFPTLSEFGQAR